MFEPFPATGPVQKLSRTTPQMSKKKDPTCSTLWVSCTCLSLLSSICRSKMSAVSLRIYIKDIKNLHGQNEVSGLKSVKKDKIQ